MRKIIENQMEIGQIPFSEIKIDLKSRDEIPKILLGLKHIYQNEELFDRVCAVLKKLIPNNIDKSNGRPGMHLWRILVLGAIRLGCNWDYDKLHDIANNHNTIRQIMGHSIYFEDIYSLQTIKDNVSLFTADILNEINDIVIEAGHDFIGVKEDDKLKGRCDSFVVETDVHYPTDINLLFDAIRKIIELTAQLCSGTYIMDWRQSKYILKKVKKYFNKVRKMKRSNSKNKEKKAAKEQLLIGAYKEYIALVISLINKAAETIEKFDLMDIYTKARANEIVGYMFHAERQINQIEKRVINSEKIPHNEKIFSLFEWYTEWIKKGKAGVQQELGLKVCILEDQFGFILNHKIMQKQTDDKIAVPIIRETLSRFPNLYSCSFDKGFHSPDNKEELKELLPEVILPKKGKLSIAQKEEEHSEEFIKARHQHSAVESAISALENHGLDRCPDKGLHGFERYVGLAVLSRNIQILGGIIRKKELKSIKRREKYNQTRNGTQLKQAA